MRHRRQHIPVLDRSRQVFFEESSEEKIACGKKTNTTTRSRVVTHHGTCSGPTELDFADRTRRGISSVV